MSEILNNNTEIFGYSIDPDYMLVAGLVGLFLVLFAIRYGFILIGRLFRLWLASLETVLSGDELDDATRMGLTSAFELLPDETILGYRYRRFLFAPDESLVITDKRVSHDQALGRTTLPISETGESLITRPRKGRFVIGPFEFTLQGRNKDGAYGNINLHIMGGPKAEKFAGIVTGAIARHKNDDADERVPRQWVTRKARPYSERGLYRVIVAVPVVIGLALLALAWSELSPSLERLAASDSVLGEVVGYQEKFDRYEMTNAYYPTVRFTDKNGETRTFTSSVGGMKIYQIGEQVEVLHDRTDPLKAAIHSYWELFLGAAIFALLGALFFGLGIALAMLVRKGV